MDKGEERVVVTMIYLFDDIASFSDSLFWRSLQVIPKERANKAMKFRNMIDRKLSVIAYLLLAAGVKKEYGILEELVFGFGEQEKPYLLHYPEILFNLSHCKQGVVCVISKEVVGIDIEEVSPYDDDVAKYICSESEYERLRSSTNPALEFCKLWTVKESVLKFTGQGICTDLTSVLDHIDYKIETSCAPDQGYVISVCQKDDSR